jgi:hypothetical protein
VSGKAGEQQALPLNNLQPVTINQFGRQYLRSSTVASDTNAATGDGTKLEDLINAPCADCGTILTEDEIKTQAQKMAAEAFRRKFGDGGMKIEI